MFIKQQRGRELWVIFSYCIYCFLNDSIIFRLDGESPSDLLRIIFTYVEFILFVIFFRAVIQNPIYRLILLIVSILFVLSAFLPFLMGVKYFNHLDSQSVTIEAIILIVTCLFFFFEQISKPQTLFIYQTPAFWIVVGILLYFAGAFFIFIYAENLTDDELQKYWDINYAVNATKYILFAIGFMAKNNKDEYPSLTNHFNI